jgi:hypothetical protein
MAADPLKQLANFNPATTASTAAENFHWNIFNNLALNRLDKCRRIAKGLLDGRRSLS